MFRGEPRQCLGARRPRWGLALAVGVGLASACSETPRGPRLVNFEPPDVSLGPREVRLDEASGAELTRPHGAWHFASTTELAAWDKDALLGLANEAGTCWGWVAIGMAGDGDPRRHSQALLAGARTPSTRTEVDEYVLYTGHTAHRWEVETRGSPGAAEAEGTRTTTLVERARRYTVTAHARGTDYRRRRHCLDEITSAFSLRLPAEP